MVVSGISTVTMFSIGAIGPAAESAVGLCVKSMRDG